MIKAYIQILRPINLLITLACIIVTSLILNQFSYDLIPLIITILCLTAFANIINDLFDYQIDQTNRPDRPLPSGNITYKSAVILSILLFLISIFIILIYNFNSLTQILIFCINLPLIIFYTPFFKKIPLLGNIIVAFILSMVFIVTTFYLEGDINQIIPPATLAFMLMLTREVVKDIADIKGDSIMKINTFPVLYGINNSIRLVLGLIFFLILTTFYFASYYNRIYIFSVILLVDIPLLYFSIKLFKNRTASYCKYLEKVLKLLTIFGVIVIYLATAII